MSEDLHMLDVFYDAYFSVDNFKLRTKPKPETIIQFLSFRNKKSSFRHRNMLALFVFDFWKLETILIKPSKEDLKKFLNKFY